MGVTTGSSSAPSATLHLGREAHQTALSLGMIHNIAAANFPVQVQGVRKIGRNLFGNTEEAPRAPNPVDACVPQCVPAAGFIPAQASSTHGIDVESKGAAVK